jgi:hypothetical protein
LTRQGDLGIETYFVGLLPEAELSLDVVFLGVLDDCSLLGPASLDVPFAGFLA